MGVEHGIQVVSSGPNFLLLQFHPGPAPSRQADIARLTGLIEDVRRSIDGSSFDETLREKEARFQVELGKLTPAPH